MIKVFVLVMKTISKLSLQQKTIQLKIKLLSLTQLITLIQYRMRRKYFKNRISRFRIIVQLQMNWMCQISLKNLCLANNKRKINLNSKVIVCMSLLYWDWYSVSLFWLHSLQFTNISGNLSRDKTQLPKIKPRCPIKMQNNYRNIIMHRLLDAISRLN